MSTTKIIFGLLLVVIGFLILGNNLGLFDISVEEFLSVAAPVLLIALGLWLILRRRRENAEGPSVEVHFQQSGPAASSTSPYAEAEDTPEPPPSVEATANGTGRVRFRKTFGDMYVDCNGLQLQNMEVSSFVGDVDLNLSGGILRDGLNRMVISGFVGDLKLVIPKNMEVMCHVSNFAGDIDVLGRRVSGFGNNIDGQTPGYTEAETKLFIAINSFLGDMRVFQAG